MILLKEWRQIRCTLPESSHASSCSQETVIFIHLVVLLPVPASASCSHQAPTLKCITSRNTPFAARHSLAYTHSSRQGMSCVCRQRRRDSSQATATTSKLRCRALRHSCCMFLARPPPLRAEAALQLHLCSALAHCLLLLTRHHRRLSRSLDKPLERTASSSIATELYFAR